MTSNTVVVVTASMISFSPDRKQTLLQNLCQSDHSRNLVAVAVLPMSTLAHSSFAQFVLFALCVLYVLWMCFCAHTSTCGFAPPRYRNACVYSSPEQGFVSSASQPTHLWYHISHLLNLIWLHSSSLCCCQQPSVWFCCLAQSNENA